MLGAPIARVDRIGFEKEGKHRWEFDGEVRRETPRDVRPAGAIDSQREGRCSDQCGCRRAMSVYFNTTRGASTGTSRLARRRFVKLTALLKEGRTHRRIVRDTLPLLVRSELMLPFASV
jgi:hypothetical protein